MRSIFGITVLTLLLQGCGHKGALMLPAPPVQTSQIPSPPNSTTVGQTPADQTTSPQPSK
jgi:predicted small lipoprotein YifL